VGGKFEKKKVGGTKKFEGRKNMGRVRRGFSLGKSDQNAVCVCVVQKPKNENFLIN